MRTLLIILTLLFYTVGVTQTGNTPYLKVLTKGGEIPLKRTEADVQIAGTIAHVKLTQVYHNSGSEPIEALYVFPMSLEAAIHDMQMTIGLRTIKATIEEKTQANKMYNEALRTGKRASKLEQARPNVFQMNVGNIMPEDEIKIEIYYTEMLIPEKGMYSFVLPGVVGPRYVGESSKHENWTNTPYTEKGVKATYDHDIRLVLNAGMTIQDVHSKTHDLTINFPHPFRAEISLRDSTDDSSNRDFIFNYSLRGSQIETGLLLYEGEDENFFSYLMEPPQVPKAENIPPREYFFVVDVSGSMRGYPIEVSKNLMRNLLGTLRADDAFNILLFASSSKVLSPEPLNVNEGNIGRAIKFLDKQQGGGGTNLLHAMNRVYNMASCSEHSSRSIVVITDGYISVEKSVFDLIQKNLNRANVFAFGIGSSVNRYLIEGMARCATGKSFVVTNRAECSAIASEFTDYIRTPLLTQIKFQTNGFEVFDMVPQSVPDIFSSRPVQVFGKWKGKPSGTIVISGYSGFGKFETVFDVSNAVKSNENKVLKYLWARKKIELLDDYRKLFHEDEKQAIIELGLKYNLATHYTSFVAIDTEVVNATGETKVVKQPLPMPKNVENSAVGADAEIVGSSTATKAYSLTIEDRDSLSASDELKIKIWFGKHFPIITNLTHESKDFRISVDERGVLYKVEKLINGNWVTDNNLLKLMHKSSYSRLTIGVPFSLNIKF